MKDGVPCFSVADDRAARQSPPKLSVIAVSHEDAEKGGIWYQSFKRDQPAMRLHPSECLAYGTGVEEAQELQEGVHYVVNIFADFDEYSNWYHAYFCLYRTEEGEMKIHHAKVDNRIHAFDWRMCDNSD